MVTLIKSAPDNTEYGWLKESAAVDVLARSSLRELESLAKAFLTQEDLGAPPAGPLSYHKCQHEVLYPS